MAKKKAAKKKPAKKAATFRAEEKAARKERARELKREQTKADGESVLLEKVAAMPPKDRAMAKKIHAIVKKNAPDLVPRTWYGMPAYSKDDKVVLFFKDAAKFKARYAELGFNDAANLDDGNMWPTAFALTKITPAEEKKITALVKKAVR